MENVYIFIKIYKCGVPGLRGIHLSVLRMFLSLGFVVTHAELVYRGMSVSVQYEEE